MTQTLPSLFGRFTAVLQDHEDLAKTLRRLRAMCAALDDGRASFEPELAPDELLGQLQVALEAHFAAEESADYFGVVEDEEPSLAIPIAGLKAEHMTMLSAAKVLRELSRDRGRWPHISSPTRELVGQLERHERAESKLLRKLFFAKP
jgi:hypothetical protein